MWRVSGLSAATSRRDKSVSDIIVAVESRKRKKSHIDGLESKLKEREFAYQLLQLHCKNLEQQ